MVIYLLWYHILIFVHCWIFVHSDGKMLDKSFESLELSAMKSHGGRSVSSFLILKTGHIMTGHIMTGHIMTGHIEDRSHYTMIVILQQLP